jgi:hypothetical protein
MILARCGGEPGRCDREKLISLAYDEAAGGTAFVVVNRVKILRRDGISRTVQINVEEIFGANGKKTCKCPFL